MRNRALLASVGVLALGVSFVSFGSRTSSQAATVTTAWHGGAFGVDVANVVRQSDIVLGRANTRTSTGTSTRTTASCTNPAAA